jgi:hypothetical protein
MYLGYYREQKNYFFTHELDCQSFIQLLLLKKNTHTRKENIFLNEISNSEY